METRYRVVDTQVGLVAFVASERGLRRVYLPERDRGQLQTALEGQCPQASEQPDLMPEFADELRRYFAGQPVQFTVRLDATGWSNFEADVWQACREIEYGATESYKQLAERVARPGGARAVGMAMSHNPCPIVVPCHRVLRSDGAIGGYSGPGGIDFKRQLLEMEAGASQANVK